MAQEAVKIKQFRYYNEGNENNSPAVGKAFYQNEVSFSYYAPIQQVGIQTLPGTKFYLNQSADPIIIGSTGIYELDLRNTTAILSSFRFDKNSMDIINNLKNGYLVIDLVYSGGN